MQIFIQRIEFILARRLSSISKESIFSGREENVGDSDREKNSTLLQLILFRVVETLSFQNEKKGRKFSSTRTDPSSTVINIFFSAPPKRGRVEVGKRLFTGVLNTRSKPRGCWSKSIFYVSGIGSSPA